jgi:Domain of unknown function (DUF4062)
MLSVVARDHEAPRNCRAYQPTIAGLTTTSSSVTLNIPMIRPKKLQVFVSSTFTDMKEERQAAVEAILTAGHIPAGMELFAAGDRSQLEVIRSWIDDSDVFLLLLGGRYGSVEPSSRKSYVQLEYEYAEERGKPLFAVVIDKAHLDEKVKRLGVSAVETSHGEALETFRNVVTSKVVRFWASPQDIKLAVLETLPHLARRDDIEGWVRASTAVDVAPLANEVARLSAENAALREQVSKTTDPQRFNGLTFSELYDLLSRSAVPRLSDKHMTALQNIADVFGDQELGLVHLLWAISTTITQGVGVPPESMPATRKLEEFGLIHRPNPEFGEQYYELTAIGKQFLLRLRRERNVEAAEKFRI